MDPIHDAMMKPLREAKPNSRASHEAVRREMAKEVDKLQKFLPGYHIAERPLAFADEFLRAGFNLGQVQEVCQKARTQFGKMPAWKDLADLSPRKMRSSEEKQNDEFRRATRETAARVQGIENVKNTVGAEGWEWFLGVWRKEYLGEDGVQEIGGLNFGFFTEHFAFFCYRQGGGKSKKAIEVLHRELSDG